MRPNECVLTARVRERPPLWRRGEEPQAEPEPRAWREREPFEDGAGFELYPGATVMEDRIAADDEPGAIRILARYSIVRLVTLVDRRTVAGPKLRTERRIALEHVALLPAYDWERLALQRVADLCRETPAPLIGGALVVAAECAAKRGHMMGAFALYRACYELSLARRWWGEAARGALGVAALADISDAPRSRLLWARRARVLQRRDDRETAAADAAAAERPE